ncbi:TPA: phage tail tape measure protein, partial [Citrobacter farmeri]|nr:phage tail tape measure protein [Citrobacter farmeri]
EENASREAVAESDRQKYAAQAQANYTKTQSALEKYTQRQNELNKALKEGRILQADYNINMSAAKKEYEDSLKKPGKAPAVKTPSGVRAVDTASAQTIELQAQLRTLQEHRSITDTISQQRQELWRQQSRFTVLEEAAKTRTLSTQEKSLLA